MKRLSFRELSVSRETDVRRLQAVLESAPSYYRAIRFKRPSANEALCELTNVPEGLSVDRKHMLLIEQAGMPVGCIDILRGHPESGVAFIGLLLLVDSCRGRGLGREALEFAIETSVAWSCRELRGAVVSSNRRIFQPMCTCLQGQGFAELCTKRSEQYDATLVVMKRVLR
jgi:predicted GNAT family N-acyltransferase